MTDDSLFLIDVDKILRTKAPKQYKYIPKFVVSYLKKIVHQDEINVFLNESINWEWISLKHAWSSLMRKWR